MESHLHLAFTNNNIQHLLNRLEDPELWRNSFLERYLNNQFHYPFKKVENAQQCLNILSSSTNFTNFLSSLDNLIPINGNQQAKRTDLGIDRSLNILNGLATIYQFGKAGHPTVSSFGSDNVFNINFLTDFIHCIDRLILTQYLSDDSLSKADNLFPSHCLQLAVLEVINVMVDKINDREKLIQLVVSLSGGIIYFDKILLGKLLELIATTSLKILLTDRFNTANEISPEIPGLTLSGDLDFTEDDSTELIDATIFPILSGMANRFLSLEEATQNLPQFLDWFELIMTMRNQPTFYALKSVLSSDNVNLKFISELTSQLCPTYLGYPTVTSLEITPRAELSHNCDFVPYLFASNIYVACQVCQGKIDRCGIKCISCLSSLHFDCHRDHGPSNETVEKVLNIKTFLKMEYCKGCNQPMLGTYNQGVKTKKTGMLYHLHCVNSEGGFIQTDSIEDLKTIENIVANNFTNLVSLERDILSNWLEINLVLTARSHSNTEEKELLNKLSKLKKSLSSNIDNTSKNAEPISPLYCQHEIHKLCANLDLTNIPITVQDLVNKMKHKLELRTDLAVYTLLAHMQLHGLVSINPVFNRPLNLPGFKVSLNQPLLNNHRQIDKSIDLRVAAILLQSDNLYGNELGLLLVTEWLPQISLLPENLRMLVVQPVLGWVIEVDIRSTRLTLKSSQNKGRGISTEDVNTSIQPDIHTFNKTTHDKLVRKYFIPWIKKCTEDLGVKSFGQLLFDCLINVESELMNRGETSVDSFDGFKLNALKQLQASGIADDLWFVLTSRWIQSALVVYRSQQQNLDDLPYQIQATLSTKVQGINFDDPGTNLWFPIVSQSFLMTNWLELIESESDDLGYALGWSELLAMAHAKLPRFVELTPIILNRTCLDLALFNQYLITLFYQLAVKSLTLPEATQINLALKNLLVTKRFQHMVKNVPSDLLERCTLLITVIGLMMTRRLYDQQVNESPKLQIHTSLASLPMHVINPVLFVPEVVSHDTEVDSVHYELEKGVASTLVYLAKHIPAKLTVVVLEALRILPPYARTHLPQDEDYVVWLWLLMVSSQQVYRPQPLDLLFEAGTISPSQLLNGISPASIIRFRGLQQGTLDGGWLWLDAAIGFLNRYTGTKSRQFPDGWKFVGPIFSAFVGFSLSDQEEFRTKFEVLIRSLEKDVVNFLLLSWTTYFDNCSLYDKIVTAKLMLHLATLVPKIPVLAWRSIVGHLTLFQNDPELHQLSTFTPTSNLSQPYQPKVQVEPMVLKVLVISLAFTLMSNRVPINMREVYTIKFLFARTLGIADAQLDARADGGYRVNLPSTITFNLQDQQLLLLIQTFLSKFKIVLDSLATIDVPNTELNPALDDTYGLNSIVEKLEGNPPIDDVASTLDQSIGTHFLDLLFKVLTSSILASSGHLTEPFLAEVVECLQILVYKYDMDHSPHFNALLPLLQRLSRLIGTSKDRNGAEPFSESLGLAILNLFHSILAKAPLLSHHILSAQVLAMIQLTSKLVKVGDEQAEVDPLAYKAKAFLTTAFRTYATNGLFILTFKNYDYEKYGDTLFKTLRLVLNEATTSQHKAAGLSGEFIPLEQPIIDVFNRLLTLPVNESTHFNHVLSNLARYVTCVHNTGFSERLLSELFVTFIPRFLKHVSEWQPSQLDATPLYVMLTQIVTNHPFASEFFIHPLKNLLKVTVSKFGFKAPALSLLLDAIKTCFEDPAANLGVEGMVEFGSIILEEFVTSLTRNKPKVLSSHLCSLVKTLLYVSTPESKLDASDETIQYLMQVLDGEDDVDRLEDLVAMSATAPRLYLMFQDLPDNLIPGLLSYLNEPHHFTKRHPTSFTTGVQLSYLLVHLYLEKVVVVDSILMDLYPSEPRKMALALSWFLTSTVARQNLDFVPLASRFQPYVLKVIRDAISAPIQGEVSSTMYTNLSDDASIHSSINFRYPGQLLCLGMLLIKLWVRILHRCDDHYLHSTSPSAQIDLDDPFLPSALKSSFWFSIWPILLGILVPGLNSDVNLNSKEIKEGYKDIGGKGSVAVAITSNLLAEIILIMASLHQLDSLPGLIMAEVTAFFRDFTVLEPQLATDSKFRLARAALNGDVIQLQFESKESILHALYKELANLLAP